MLLTLLIFLFSSAPGSFVDMYEREDYFYIFMREKASESSTDSSSQVRERITGDTSREKEGSFPLFTVDGPNNFIVFLGTYST